MENAQIAAIFDEIADLLELKGDNEFRIRSYRNAARTVRDLSQRVEDLVHQGEKLEDLPNIGKSTAGKICEILESGTCNRLEELQKKVPPGLTMLMRLPQFGPRKSMQVYKALKIQSLEELKKACEEHRLAELKGMGEKTEQNILRGLKTLEAPPDRFLYPAAAAHVESLGRYLDRIKPIKQWEVAGSFRRRMETIGDLDILVQADDRKKATDQIIQLPAIREVLGRGRERVTVRLDSGLQVDFRFFEAKNFGSALMYFTGSKAHNIHLRKLALQEYDYKLNEYGLFEGKRQIAGKDEESVFAKLGLSWAPPEIREDRGEIEAALEDSLPRLIELKDVRGDLQSHTKETDGVNTIEEMAKAARECGYQFFAITDHSKSVAMARGLNEGRLRKHADRIRTVNETMKGFWLMAGVEVDILKDGKLDLKERALAELDWVVASIHYNRDMPEKQMTERLLAAIRSGVVHCIGHPCGRIIGKRDPIRFDFEKIIEACVEFKVCLEVNGQPDRLDLPDTYCKQARDAGVKFTFGTDAHKLSDLGFMALAVNVARRGWLEKKDVLNTLTARQLKGKLKRG